MEVLDFPPTPAYGHRFLLPFSFQFFTRLAAVFAEAALRGNGITTKH